jgi:uncharacterized protein (TIGR02118 family)
MVARTARAPIPVSAEDGIKMLKIVTLIKRRPNLSVEDFQAYWADRHGPLLRQAPGLRRYVQSHALPQGYRKGELLFDGTNELWFDDESAYAAYLASDVFKAVDRDLDAFVDRVRLVEMPVDVHVIKDGVIPPNAVKNIEFVNRRPGMALAPFRAYWRNVHGSIAAEISAIHRYEQNHLKQSAYVDHDPPYDGLAITWFAATADMKRATTTPEYQRTRADEPNFLPDGHLPIIIAREWVI